MRPNEKKEEGKRKDHESTLSLDEKKRKRREGFEANEKKMERRQCEEMTFDHVI